MEHKNKSGPKGSYAVRKIMNKLTENDKKKLRKRYYIERITKKTISKELELSPQLINDLLAELGPLKETDLSS